MKTVEIQAVITVEVPDDVDAFHGGLAAWAEAVARAQSCKRHCSPRGVAPTVRVVAAKAIDEALLLVAAADRDDRSTPELDAYDEVLAAIHRQELALGERHAEHEKAGRTRAASHIDAKCEALALLAGRVEHMKAEVTG